MTLGTITCAATTIAIHAAHAQSHHALPAAPMIQSTAAQERDADHGAEGDALGGVGEPEPPGHAVEAEALLEAKRRVPLERQLEDGADDDEGDDQRDLVGERAGARRDRVAHRRIERVEAAEQRPAEQHGGAGDHLPVRQARLGERVVGGALVRGELDRRAEGRRHLVAVERDVAHLAREQPGADRQRRDQRGGEQRSSRARRRHGASVGAGAHADECCENLRREHCMTTDTALTADDHNLVWIDLEMTGLDPDARPDHRDRRRRHRRAARPAHRGPGAGDPPERRDARRDGRLEHGHARQERPDRPRARLDGRRGRGRAPGDRVPAALRQEGRLADVRQHASARTGASSP